MPVRLTIRPSRASKPQVVEFDDAEVTIGRSSRCDIRLPFRSVSGHHLTITQSPSSLQVRDENSTNGTLLDGEPLPSGVERRLSWGARLEILDLSIEVELIPDLGAGLSLGHTGTMARQMLGEALLGSASTEQELESAYFEVIEGPARGRRYVVPDDLDDGRIADEEDALIHIPGLSVALELYRDGDGFGLRVPHATEQHSPLHINDSRLVGERHLVSGDTIACARTRLRFVDPLEAYLDELDGVVPVESGALESDEAVDSPHQTEPIEESEQEGKEVQETKDPDVSTRSWSALEVGVIAASLVVLAGVIYLLLSIFGVV